MKLNVYHYLMRRLRILTAMPALLHTSSCHSVGTFYLKITCYDCEKLCSVTCPCTVLCLDVFMRQPLKDFHVPFYLVYIFVYFAVICLSITVLAYRKCFPLNSEGFLTCGHNNFYVGWRATRLEMIVSD
jgi:hypothetical protein